VAWAETNQTDRDYSHRGQHRTDPQLLCAPLGNRTDDQRTQKRTTPGADASDQEAGASAQGPAAADPGVSVVVAALWSADEAGRRIQSLAPQAPLRGGCLSRTPQSV
jgi:hypothetical protein